MQEAIEERIEEEPREQVGRFLLHAQQAAAVLAVHGHGHECGPKWARAGAQAQAPVRLDLLDDRVIFDPAGDRVVELRARRRPLGIGGSDLTGADDPIGVGAGVAEHLEAALGRCIDVRLDDCHAVRLPASSRLTNPGATRRQACPL